MKKIVAVTFLLICHHGLAANIECQIAVNTIIDQKNTFEINAKESFTYGQYQEFKFKLNAHGHDQYEIEVFDSNTPARSYAEGNLNLPDQQVKWAYWSREVLIETVCKLNNI